MSTKGLGRGLNALLSMDVLSGMDAAQKEERITTLPVDRIVPNPAQPRKTMEKEALEELARSIRHKGILQPLLVRRTTIPGQYELVAGERRWRAARMAELKEVPVYVRDLTDDEVMIVALMENLQREDLNPAEEARALQTIRDKMGLTQEELASRLGKSRSMVANALRLLQLPERALESLQKGEITAGHARCLLGLVDAGEALDVFLTHMLAEHLSVRDSEDVLAHWKAHHALPWEDGESSPKAPEKKERRHKSQELRAIERSLSEHLGSRARLSGTQDEGKVSISYKSREELARLLAALGMETDGTH